MVVEGFGALNAFNIITKSNEELLCVDDVVEVLLYVHRNRRLIRDGSPGRPPRLSHSSDVCWCWWSLLYSAILRSRPDSLLSYMILHQWLTFLWRIFEYPPKWCTYSADMAVGTWNCCHLGAFCVHPTTIHHVTSLHAKIYVRRVHTCLTCHLPFWQNDRDHLRATAVSRGWNWYQK